VACKNGSVREENGDWQRIVEEFLKRKGGQGKGEHGKGGFKMKFAKARAFVSRKLKNGSGKSRALKNACGMSQERGHGGVRGRGEGVSSE